MLSMKQSLTKVVRESENVERWMSDLKFLFRVIKSYELVSLTRQNLHAGAGLHKEEKRVSHCKSLQNLQNYKRLRIIKYSGLCW